MHGKIFNVFDPNFRFFLSMCSKSNDYMAVIDNSYRSDLTAMPSHHDHADTRTRHERIVAALKLLDHAAHVGGELGRVRAKDGPRALRVEVVQNLCACAGRRGVSHQGRYLFRRDIAEKKVRFSLRE